jgi:hypothetical protein
MVQRVRPVTRRERRTRQHSPAHRKSDPVEVAGREEGLGEERQGRKEQRERRGNS